MKAVFSSSLGFFIFSKGQKLFLENYMILTLNITEGDLKKTSLSKRPYSWNNTLKLTQHSPGDIFFLKAGQWMSNNFFVRKVFSDMFLPQKGISPDGFHLSSGRAWPILFLMKADQ